MNELIEKKIFSQNSGFTLSNHLNDLSKRWYVRFYTIGADGQPKLKKVYGNINRKKTVEERTEAGLLLLHTLKNTPLQTEEATININEQCLEIFNLLKKHLRQKTISTYRTKIYHFLDWCKSNHVYSFKNITADHLKKYSYSISKNSNTTINNYITTIKTLLNYAVELGFMYSVPKFNFKKLPENRTSRTYFKTNEIAILKQEIVTNPLQWCATQLLFYCFIRPGEIRLLKAADVNIDLGVITIRGDISKNKKTQSVVIPNVFMPYITTWIDGLAPDFFLINKSDTPLSRDFISKNHRIILLKLGFGKGYSFYSWKPTGAIYAKKNGISLKDIQLQMRHHSLDQTNEYFKSYGVLDAEDLRDKYPTL